jgi:hypothetical protein
MLHTLVLGMLGTPRGLCPDCVGPSLQNEQCSSYVLIALRERTGSKVHTWVLFVNFILVE